VLGVHDVRAEYIGPDVVHAGMHLEVPPDMSVREANSVADEVRRRLHDGTDPGYCVIQIDATRAQPA
jgi:divalent metal cation (Fe/Co/Zn/Cd) transporter